jgi:isopenicillin N synthase-like dioxygenase
MHKSVSYELGNDRKARPLSSDTRKVELPEHINPKEKSNSEKQKTRQVPTLDLSNFLSGSKASQSEFSNQLFIGLKEYGFIVLKGHGIDEDLLHWTFDLAKIFFDLSDEVKALYDASSNAGQRGYTPFGKEHAKGSSVVDLKEFWHIGQELSCNHPYRTRYPKNMWPKELPEFRGEFLRLYGALESTGKVLLKALTGPLDLPADFFTEMTTDGNSILRILHYPPIPANADPRCLRAAAHEDINLITLLVTASASGLQLKDRDGEWLDVESEPDEIIVDAGDMLARITNNLIPATTHRVINPDDRNSHRYSMPFFMHPHPDALLSCIPSCRGDKVLYPDITAQDFLMERLKEIGLS